MGYLWRRFAQVKMEVIELHTIFRLLDMKVNFTGLISTGSMLLQLMRESNYRYVPAVDWARFTPL